MLKGGKLEVVVVVGQGTCTWWLRRRAMTGPYKMMRWQAERSFEQQQIV